MTRIIILTIAVLLVISFGATAETITTKDGRRIQLKEDGTYETLKSETNPGYKSIDFVDLKLDPGLWDKKRIKIKGFAKASRNIGSSGAPPVVGYLFDVNKGNAMLGPFDGSVYVKLSIYKVPNVQLRELIKRCSKKAICFVEVSGLLEFGILTAHNFLILKTVKTMF